MPSIQHDLLKLSLNSLSFSLPLRGSDVGKLRAILDFSALWSMLPWGVHFKPFHIEGLKAEWLIPNRADKTKAILYLHGGGYALGSSHTHRSMVGQIAKTTGLPCLIIGYRKIPESPFPAALDDAVTAYEWLLEQGYKGSDIVIGGDSAGGGLALAMQLVLKNKCLPLPSGTICFSPWTDLAVTGASVHKNASKDPLVRVDKMEKWGNMYAAHRLLNNPLISPLYGDLRGLSPILIQVSKDEILYDDSIRLVKAAKKAGVKVTLQEWPGLIHWWQIFWRILPEAEEAIDRLKDLGAYGIKPGEQPISEALTT